MIGHISFGVSDLGRSTAFYDATLSALGYVQVHVDERAVGYGAQGTTNDRFKLILQPEAVRPPSAGFHLAFAAPNRASVDAFHRAALENGGTDQGRPGLRPAYGADYYAAFVLDPDGYKLEAKHPPPLMRWRSGNCAAR